MLSALIIALREGVEAALVVGIVLVYLNRTGRRSLTAAVWIGVVLAVAASFAAAVLLDRWHVSEDGFEGLLMLVAAALVVTMIIWMNRVARRLKKEIEERVEAYTRKSTRAAAWGVGLFVFLMVVREGAELVLILRAVEFSSAGVQVWIGTGLGIAIAVAVGLFFFQGTLRIPLHRFFAATSAMLIVVAFQLTLTGLHEMSEALWIWHSKSEMAIVGPIVRNELFFFVVILGAAALVVLREWFGSKTPSSDAPLNAAERRKREWEVRRQRRWSLAAAVLCMGVILAFAAEYVYARTMNAPAQAKPVTAIGNEVRIPLAELTDASLHFYSVGVDATSVRFLVIHKTNGDYAAALDACQICGNVGYRQEGQNIVCRNCGAVLNAPSIGTSGGCNPIPLNSRVEGVNVIVDLSALSGTASTIQH